MSIQKQHSPLIVLSIRIVLGIVFLFCNGSLFAQIVPGQNQGDPKQISIHSEDNQIIDATFLPATQYLNGNVQVYHSGTFMYCDRAVLKGSTLKMYSNVVLLQNDTIKIFADSLHYNGDSLVAFLYGDIILENGPTKKLYTSFLKFVSNK